MKNLKLKIKEIVSAYSVLSEALYGKMADEDKIKVWKISRQLKPVAVKYEEDRADALKKLITDVDFSTKLAKALEYEQKIDKGETENLPMTKKEYSLYMTDIKKNMLLMEKALQELLDTEVEIEFEPLSETAFGLLIASNSWKIKLIDFIDFIVEL